MLLFLDLLHMQRVASSLHMSQGQFPIPADAINIANSAPHACSFVFNPSFCTHMHTSTPSCTYISSTRDVYVCLALCVCYFANYVHESRAVDIHATLTWCMRSRVTISRSVLYQIRGPLKMTIHGSNTPTQILWRQLSIVFLFQSASVMLSSLPVPCHAHHGKENQRTVKEMKGMELVRSGHCTDCSMQYVVQPGMTTTAAR